jgi:hypothetical protein
MSCLDRRGRRARLSARIRGRYVTGRLNSASAEPRASIELSMRDLASTPRSRETPPARPRRREKVRTEPLSRRGYDREQRDALRHRALVSAWLRTLARPR